MVKKTFNENSEAGILSNLSGSISEIKKKFEPVMTERANAEILQNMQAPNNVDSLSTMTQESMNNSSLNGEPNSLGGEAKAKTLVRKAPNTPRVIPAAPKEEVKTETPRVSTGEPVQEVPENYFDTIRNGGSINATSVFIVIASFVIIAMLIMICLTILGSLGIRL